MLCMKGDIYMIYMWKRTKSLELVNFLSKHNRYAIFNIVNDKEDIIEISTNLSDIALAKIALP